MSEAFSQLWGQHMALEFGAHDPEAAVATMTDDAYVLNVPVMTGGRGRDGVRRFYAEEFIPHLPPDIAITHVSTTVGADQLVDELIVAFTHTTDMPWFLPGVAPTNRRVEFPLVVIVGFRDGKISHERLYWDHASVLSQVGALGRASVGTGAEQAERLAEWAKAVLPGADKQA
jgi:carboxymethylenebutenolidase